MVTFDQSIHRRKDNPPKAQREAKRRWLREQGVESFYYASHAPFLFAFPDKQAHKDAAELLKIAGIPNERIEE